MVTLLFVIFVVITIIIFKREKQSNYYGPSILLVFLALFSIALGLCTFINVYEIATSYTIDQKIEMYQSENNKIEENISTSVKNYMDYEKETFVDLKNEDAVNLVSVYPELKSDTLISQQINVYISNNNEIKRLQESKIELAKVRWLTYFGK